MIFFFSTSQIFSPSRQKRKKKKETQKAHAKKMSRASYDTFNGLNAILESPRWPVDQACAAVERCLEVNR